MVAEAIAPNEAAAPLVPPIQTAFYKDEVPNGSIQDPHYIQAMLYVVFQLASLPNHFSI